MQEINKPDKRTFWEITDSKGAIIHKGFTDVNQVTTTGHIIAKQDSDASKVYPELPKEGVVEEGEIYSLNGNMVKILKTHEINSEESDKIEVFKKNDESERSWKADEEVIAGDKRLYNGVTYICLYNHLTEDKLTPDIFTKCWKEFIEDIKIEPKQEIKK